MSMVSVVYNVVSQSVIWQFSRELLEMLNLSSRLRPIYWIRICILIRSAEDLYVYLSLRRKVCEGYILYAIEGMLTNGSF